MCTTVQKTASLQFHHSCVTSTDCDQPFRPRSSILCLHKRRCEWASSSTVAVCTEGLPSTKWWGDRYVQAGKCQEARGHTQGPETQSVPSTAPCYLCSRWQLSLTEVASAVAAFRCKRNLPSKFHVCSVDTVPTTKGTSLTWCFDEKPAAQQLVHNLQKTDCYLQQSD